MTESETNEAELLRASMECVVLPPRPGAPPSNRPAVEIFLGTEPAQYRANRVFGFSIEKARDPGRTVRIHFMSELEGFDRRGWTTGFTNYRFAIPALCRGRGRAIYNDEDEIYLTDPGRLFDLELGGAGYLAISDTESSVMLIDCARMAPVWTLAGAQHAWKRSLLRKASRATGHRGELDPHWNARDEEFVPGRSHLLHYTTLHTQPWRPFPERFVYQEGAYTHLWHDLEREAIASGFELFRRAAPSKRFVAHRRRLESVAKGELPSAMDRRGVLAGAVESLARQAKAHGLVEILPDLRGATEQRPGRFGLDFEHRCGLLEWLDGAPMSRAAEGVVCVDGLEALPVWDVPWIVESLFSGARRFVFVAVRCRETPRRRFLHPPAGTAFTPDWWRSHFEAAAARHPHVRWELVTTRGRDFERDGHRIAFGGPRLDATPPRIWTLTDGARAHVEATAALAQRLGGAVASAIPPTVLPSGPPWPDLLIAAGRSAARPARRIRTAANGRCLLVALGAEAALPVDEVDLAVVQPDELVFPHPRRLDVDWPLVAPAPRRAAGDRGVVEEMASPMSPRLFVLLEQDERAVAMTPEEALAFGRRVGESARALGASVATGLGRGCSPSLAAAYRSGLATVPDVAVEDAGVEPDALEARFATATAIVLGGPGESTLARACEAGRPVFVAESDARARSDRPSGIVARALRAVEEAVLRRAQARPGNDRGTTRPQEGLEWLCAKGVERGTIRPHRLRGALAAGLVAKGRVRVLETALAPHDLDAHRTEAPDAAESRARSSLDPVARRVRRMLGTDATR
ncbi:MAG: ELM1/GtrOC1 family putative glycosyltransferase [Myxococcota bacterium]